MADHVDGAQFIMRTLDDIFVQDRGRVFYKHKHVWIENERDIKRELLNHVHTFDVLKRSKFGLTTQTRDM